MREASIITRWRRWGRPKARASTTRYAHVYPRSSSASVMCRMAAPLAELQHERHVLDQQPARTLLALDQTEHLVHQAGSCAGDACRSSGLGEVLAGETGGDQFDVAGQRAQRGDVGVQRHVGRIANGRTAWAPGSISHSSSVFHPCSESPNSSPPIPANKPTMLRDDVTAPFLTNRPRSTVLENSDTVCQLFGLRGAPD